MVFTFALQRPSGLSLPSSIKGGLEPASEVGINTNWCVGGCLAFVVLFFCRLLYAQSYIIIIVCPFTCYLGTTGTKWIEATEFVQLHQRWFGACC